MQNPNDSIDIRTAHPRDYEAINAVVRRAFADAPHSNQNEHELVAALQSGGKMALELIAAGGSDIIGYLSFTRARMVELDGEIFCLAPLAVDPDWHKRGIGSALTRAGLDRLRAQGAAACVVYGDPAYYRRFGFALKPEVSSPGLEQEYFQVLFFAAPETGGRATLEPLFSEYA